MTTYPLTVVEHFATVPPLALRPNDGKLRHGRSVARSLAEILKLELVASIKSNYTVVYDIKIALKELRDCLSDAPGRLFENGMIDFEPALKVRHEVEYILRLNGNGLANARRDVYITAARDNVRTK